MQYHAFGELSLCNRFIKKAEVRDIEKAQFRHKATYRPHITNKELRSLKLIKYASYNLL